MVAELGVLAVEVGGVAVEDSGGGVVALVTAGEVGKGEATRSDGGL